MGTTNQSEYGESGEGLRALLEDAEIRRRYFDILAIGGLLEGCVIDKNYRVTDEFVAPIRLSSLGSRIFADVRLERPRLKPNEVKLALFLLFACPEGVLIDSATDVEGMRRSLDRGIKDRKILYPYIFGRELHDRVAELAPEVSRLDNAQTVNLLRQTPIGVFQVGYITVGPLGAVVSDSPRALGPDLRFPGYRCSDPTCGAIHPIHLSTALGTPGGASIVKTNDYVRAHIAAKYSQGDESIARIVNEGLWREGNKYHLRFGDSLIETLADDFSTQELRMITEAAIRAHSKSTGMTDLSKRLAAVIHNPADYVSYLDRPTILQVLLTFSEEALVSAVDATLAAGRLNIAEFEIRERKIFRFGAGGLAAEVGTRGARYTGIGVDAIVARRLETMLHEIYYESELLSPDDLAYLLEESAPVEGGIDLLDQAVRDLSPERIVRDLVLYNRSTSLQAAKYLGVTIGSSATKSDLLPTFLWKLGALIDTDFTDLHRVERLAAEVRTQTSSSTPVDEEQLRGVLSNLFTSLEDAAQRSIEFATWALSRDHFLSPDGFLYDPAPNSGVLAYLNDNAPVEPAYELRSNGRNTLAPLAAAFGRLAKALESEDEVKRRRPALQYPVVTRYTSRPFCFPSTLPFFNLSASARVEVLDLLRQFSRLLGDEVVLRVRNGSMHGNAPFPSLGEIGLAQERIAEWRTTLLGAGLYPRVYRLRATVQDDLGRRRHLYYSRDDELYLMDPTWAHAPGLPLGAPQLVIVPSAVFSSAGPLRFLLKSRPGRDPYWEGWPRRWSTELHHPSEESGDYGTDLSGRSRQEALEG